MFVFFNGFISESMPVPLLVRQLIESRERSQDVAAVKGHVDHLSVQSESVLAKRILIHVFRVRIIRVRE